MAASISMTNLLDHDGGEAFRLSFAQERIWFLEQLHPGTPVFTISTALEAEGKLDPVCLRLAFADLVARHEALRTRFVQGAGGPVQEVLPQAEVPFEIVDLRGADSDELRVDSLIRSRRAQPFDLGQAPLMRAHLFQVAALRSVLLVSVHHIICDGRSAEILWRDLTELYRAAVQGTSPNLPELPVHYADFAEWQRDTVDERLMVSQLNFWRHELEGTNGRIDLPTDRPRPALRDSRGGRLTRTLDGVFSASLLQAAQAAGVSSFMLLLAAYEVALSRTSGRGDFCIGATIGGRTQPETEEVLGCFINLLPIRSDTIGDPTLGELLRRVRQRCLRAYANADLPFERLVEQQEVARDLARTPLFEVLLTVQHGRTGTVELDGLTLSPQLVVAETAQYDLAVDVALDTTGGAITLSYAAGLFDEATVATFFDRFQGALLALSGDLAQPISKVPMSASADGAAWLKGEERPDWLSQHCAETLRRALAAGPDRIRVLGCDTAWEARRLWTAAASVADKLCKEGLQPGSTVGVYLGDDAARLASWLGVWLAGGAVVPLDADQPIRWLERQRTAALAAIVINDTTDFPGGRTLHWTEATEAHASLEEPLSLDPALPAAVSVLLDAEPPSSRIMQGGALASALRGLADAWGLTVSDRVTFEPTVISVVEPVAALAAGCAVGFAPRGQLDGPGLASTLASQASTTALLSEDAWTRVLDSGWIPPPGFRAIFPEPPPADATRHLLDAGARVLFLLGPTDGGAWYATGEVRDPDAPLKAIPLPNIRIEVVDAARVPALPGATGELVLCGSAAPFSPDGHSGGAAGHRTGDLARTSLHGPPIVTGRVDGSWIRSRRTVRTALPEAILRTMLGIDAAAVVPAGDGQGLVAFCTPGTLDPEEILGQLRKELPDHLVPVRVQAVDRLPFREDGAIDRGALVRAGASLPRTGPGLSDRAVTHLERAILECFGRSLARSDLGVHDDFFAAGGTSLTAARLVGALADAVGVPVPLKTLFQHPTVAELAAALRQSDNRSGRRTALQDAEEDQLLPAEITPSGPARSWPAACAFLTGATGFVGSHLLANLLQAGFAKVVCLVRGDSGEACLDRLRRQAARYSLPTGFERVVVLRGDLTEPLLGLDQAVFQALAEEVDVIYHCAAHMNFARPYRVLAPPNVQGTREVLRLACSGRPSPLHYISTLDSTADDTLRELPVPISVGKDDGYVLTKKTAEHLVLQAGERGLPIGIYRPWQITSSSVTGAVNPNDQLALCLVGILLARLAPADNPLPLRMLPVDVVVDAIIELSRSISPENPIHHFYNPRITPIGVVHEVLGELGYRLRTVPYRQWRVEVVRRTAGQVEGLLTLLANDASEVRLPSRVETSNTMERLGGAPRWPKEDAEWVRRTVSFLASEGLVPAPTDTPQLMEASR